MTASFAPIVCFQKKMRKSKSHKNKINHLSSLSGCTHSSEKVNIFFSDDSLMKPSGLTVRIRIRIPSDQFCLFRFMLINELPTESCMDLHMSISIRRRTIVNMQIDSFLLIHSSDERLYCFYSSIVCSILFS